MEKNKVLGTKLDYNEVVETLYAYLINDEAAYDICENLGVDTTRIKSRRGAWHKLKPLYQSYGFPKKYKAYKRINKGKLAEYVNENWDRYCSEAEMLAYFPEITADYTDEVEHDANREYIKPYTSTDEDSNDDYFYEEDFDEEDFDEEDYVETTTDSVVEPITEVSRPVHKDTRDFGTLVSDMTKDIDEDFENYDTSVKRWHKPVIKSYDDYTEDFDDDFDIESTHTTMNNSAAVGGSLLGVWFIIGAVLIFVLHKLGVFGHTTSLFGTVFSVLEVIFVYGSIVAFVVAIFKKTLAFMTGMSVGGIAIGLMFGAFSDGNFFVGIVILVVGVTLKKIIDGIFYKVSKVS